ncbi:MAG: glycerophosphodiester phosphodiesterase family protein [Leucobacter sp.]
MSHTYLLDAAHPRIIAHRGFVSDDQASRGIAENTHAAFTEAQDAGAAYLETDCHLSSDGRVVLFHDDDLGRITGDPRKIAEVHSRELTEIMSDRGGMLTLDEALEAFPDARFNVDVKADAAADDAGRSVAPHAGRVLLTSFHAESRRRALRAAACANRFVRPQHMTHAEFTRSPALPATSPDRSALTSLLLAIATRSPGRITRTLEGFDALQIPERWRGMRVLTPSLLAAAHAHGVEVHVWTVNDPDRMRVLVNRGVDGIITDRVDLALAAFS